MAPSVATAADLTFSFECVKLLVEASSILLAWPDTCAGLWRTKAFLSMPDRDILIRSVRLLSETLKKGQADILASAACLPQSGQPLALLGHKKGTYHEISLVLAWRVMEKVCEGIGAETATFPDEPRCRKQAPKIGRLLSQLSMDLVQVDLNGLIGGAEGEYREALQRASGPNLAKKPPTGPPAEESWLPDFIDEQGAKQRKLLLFLYDNGNLPTRRLEETVVCVYETFNDGNKVKLVDLKKKANNKLARIAGKSPHYEISIKSETVRLISLNGASAGKK